MGALAPAEVLHTLVASSALRIAKVIGFLETSIALTDHLTDVAEPSFDPA